VNSYAYLYYSLLQTILFENGIFSKSGTILTQVRVIRYRQRSTTTTMMSGTALELSVEQLIGALDKKLFMESTRVQSAMPPMSRAQVTTLTAEVQPQEPRGNLRY